MPEKSERYCSLFKNHSHPKESYFVMENVSLIPSNPVPALIQDAAKELHRLLCNSEELEESQGARELEEAIGRFICINEYDQLDDV